MHTRSSSSTRGGLLAVLVVALLAPALTACGVGPATNKEKISKTAITYLKALAAGDSAKACAQLTRHAQGERCEAAITARLSQLDPHALKRAADTSMDLSVQ